MSDILVCPQTGSELKPDSEYKTLENQNGYKYEIINSLPIMIANENIDSDFNYMEHYQKDASIFDYFEERSGGTEHDERRVREYVLSKIPESCSSILDVGCGKAWIAKELVKSKELICSLDISATNPGRALELYPSANHTAVVADALNLPFRDASFDCVISSEVIEHIEKPELFISELFRCVKPGGVLIITTPYKEVIKQNLCIHCNKQTPENAHLHSFDEEKLKKLYTGTDLEDYKWKAFGNKMLLHLRTHSILKYLPFSVWKMKDDAANFFINRRAHILAIYKKK